jgi:DNA-directed RNA polymerase subunit RPC12/RpoP
LGKLLQLKRVCPKCKKDQIVPQEMKYKTVLCKFCGSKIPPPRK